MTNTGSRAAPLGRAAGDAAGAPRVLEVDLARLTRAGGGGAPIPAPWRPRDPLLAEVASWGGSALGLALLRAWPAGAESPLVVAVGECVRRGLPTAARASVLSRGPLAGLLAEGQVGGELGARLAAVADALVVHGRTDARGAVLVVEEDGAARLAVFPELCGLDPSATGARLAAAFGPCAVLGVGPAGERGIPFASLATCEERPSFVGRGGLGAVLGRLGLKALCVRAAAATPPPHPSSGAATRALLARLQASPRLAARSEGGTLELYGAFAARGDLRARNYAEVLPLERARGLLDEAREARARAGERKGCRGCPTPCGWVFERVDGGRQTAHFSATYALGTNLGLERFEDALRLLAGCDRAGLDAKEVGALLALACLAVERGKLPGESAWGDVARLEGWLDDLVAGRGLGASMARGPCAFARELGLEAHHAAVRGQAVRPESDLAALLGQCVTPGGADPMRSFPFLAQAGTRERIAALLELPLPPGTEDPTDPAGKGRLVWWHENLVAGVDATGFCAFSTAGLLADGLARLDELAEWILPEALRAPADGAPGRRLLAAGATLALLRRDLNRSFGAAPDQDRPVWARAALEQPGMLAEYLELRGADETGAPTDAARARLGCTELLDVGRAALTAGAPALPARAAPRPAAPAVLGTFVLRSAAGAATTSVSLALPATLRAALAQAAAEHAELARELFHGGELRASVWRAGRRLGPEELVSAGDVLDLVTAISGG